MYIFCFYCCLLTLYFRLINVFVVVCIFTSINGHCKQHMHYHYSDVVTGDFYPLIFTEFECSLVA